MLMLEVENVHRSFGAVAALRGVSLRLEGGKTTALIGPSGCGKSTLLRLLIGLIGPDSGRVVVDGVDLAVLGGGEPLRALRRRFGYAIQSGGLFGHMTARANVALPARLAGWDAGRIATRIDALCDMTHLAPGELDRYPSELSGGQRQRVALMRALVLDPDLLLLDEPLGALDPLVRSELQLELRDLFDRLGKTVVLVTHDLAEAALLAPEDIVLMRDGVVVQRGSFDSLRRKPADGFVERFVSAHVDRVAGLVGSDGGGA